MTTRFNASGVSAYGVPPLPTGYESVTRPTLTIPSCGVEDVDVALFELFDKELLFQVTSRENTLVKVPVVFAAGEKWAKVKNGRPLRDKNGTLILPLITLTRKGEAQSTAEDITGRGINQRTGEIVIRKRLDNSDRGFQSLINRLLLNDQKNVVMSTSNEVSQLTSTRNIGDLAAEPDVTDGGLLVDNKKKNIYETLVIPSPQFYTQTYEVTFWCQYMQHSNEFFEKLLSSFLQQTQGWKITTPKGYWFIANVETDTISEENNLDDMSTEERFIKKKFDVKVPAYVFASTAPGVPINVKRYVSSPNISFDIGSNLIPEMSQDQLEEDVFLGSDDPTLPLDNNDLRDQGLRRTGRGRLYQGPSQVDENDPALTTKSRSYQKPLFRAVKLRDSSGRVFTKHIRVLSTNSYTGETVFSPDSDLNDFEIVVVKE